MHGRRREYDLTQKTVVGQLGSGEIVIDRGSSHAHLTGILLSEALDAINSDDKNNFKETVDFKEVIGESSCVETGPNDEILYAHRLGRLGISRFVLHREPVPTTQLTVVLLRTSEDPTLMLLVSAWLGGSNQPEPWDERLNYSPGALATSQEFWANHALLFDVHDIDLTRPGGTAAEMADYVAAARFL